MASTSKHKVVIEIPDVATTEASDSPTPDSHSVEIISSTVTRKKRVLPPSILKSATAAKKNRAVNSDSSTENTLSRITIDLTRESSRTLQREESPEVIITASSHPSRSVERPVSLYHQWTTDSQTTSLIPSNNRNNRTYRGPTIHPIIPRNSTHNT